MSALRELLVAFDVDTATAATKLKQLDGAITGAKGALKALAASAVSAFSLHAAAGFIEEQIELGSQLNDTAEKLGVTTTELQKFQFAAGLSGVSAEGAGTALQFLNKNLGEALAGGKEQAKTFAELGIDLAEVKDGTKNASDLLPELADKFAEAGSDAERTALAMKVFGKQGAAMIPLLKQGKEELAKLGEEFDLLGGGMQEDFVKAADDAGDEIDKLKFAAQGLKSRLAVAVLPTITEFAKKFQGMAIYAIKLTKETNIVKEALALLGVVSAVMAAKSALHWAKFFGIFPSGNAGIVKTLAQLRTIGVIIGLVAGLVLVFEDLWTGIQGGESVIREWLNETLGVEETNQLFQSLGALLDDVSVSFDGMKPLLKDITQLAKDIVLSPYFVASIEFVIRLLGSLVAALAGAGVAAARLLTGDLTGAGRAVDKAGNSIFGQGGFFGDKKPNLEGFRPKESIPFNGPSYLNPNSPDFQGGAKNIQQTNQTTINVNGAGDPGAVGRRVADFQRGITQSDLQAAAEALTTGSGGS